MLARLILALSLSLAAIAPASADLAPPDPQRVSADALKPRYDARVDASFDKFRNELLATIAKDGPALLAIVADDIRISFGDSNGKQAFVDFWQPEKPDSAIWPVLDLVVKNGGTFKIPTQFVAPYVYAIWPEDRDAFEYVAVVTPSATLRVEPFTGSAVVAKLNYDIVRLLETAQLISQHNCTETDWLKVKTKDGDEGYVLCAEVRSPVDYRAFLRKERRHLAANHSRRRRLINMRHGRA